MKSASSTTHEAVSQITRHNTTREINTKLRATCLALAPFLLPVAEVHYRPD